MYQCLTRNFKMKFYTTAFPQHRVVFNDNHFFLSSFCPLLIINIACDCVQLYASLFFHISLSLCMHELCLLLTVYKCRYLLCRVLYPHDTAEDVCHDTVRMSSKSPAAKLCISAVQNTFQRGPKKLQSLLYLHIKTSVQNG